MISDARTPRSRTRSSRSSGIIVPDEHNETITLRLFDGSVFGVETAKNTTHVTSFHIYDLNVHPAERNWSKTADPEEMSYASCARMIAKARAAAQPDYGAETEMASKFTVPFTTRAVRAARHSAGTEARARRPVGALRRRDRALLCLLLTDARGEDAGERGRLDPFVAMSHSRFRVR